MLDLRKVINNSFDGKLFMPQLNLMNASYAVSDDQRISSEKNVVSISKRAAVLNRKNKNAVTKKQRKILQILQKNVDKLHVFNSQLSQMIDTIPDTLLLNDKEGRKFITNQLTKHFFKRHELDWYGKSISAPQQLRADHKHELILLDSELLDALVKRRFKLYYQGQVDRDRQIVGAEVLLRWDHPRYGLLTANQFIPLAERTGLILPIGAWVLQAVCRQLEQWQDDPFKKDLSLTVNISLWQFSQFDFVDQLHYLLKKTGINPALLKLELTENLMLNDIGNTIKKMKILQSLGIRFSMDNFGRGYSSLSQLKKLPIDQLKIDKFLMQDIAIDSTDALIVKTIIDMTRKLGINIVTSGVETEQQFTCLKQLGCSAYQGYLFGNPMSLVEFEEALT